MEKTSFSSSNPWVTEEQSTSAVSNLLRVAERAGHLKKVGCFVSLLAQVRIYTKGVTLVYLYTVIRWTRLTRQTSKWVDSLYL